jgi:hypothetical protein
MRKCEASNDPRVYLSDLFYAQKPYLSDHVMRNLLRAVVRFVAMPKLQVSNAREQPNNLNLFKLLG